MSKKSAAKKKPLSAQIKDQVAREVFSLGGERPNLAIVIFGDDHKYIKKIKELEKEAKKCGIDTNLYICENDSSQTAAEGMIEFLNNDEAIDAIYVQSPAPESVDFGKLLEFVNADKNISAEEDFEQADWSLLEARIFENALERFRTALES